MVHTSNRGWPRTNEPNNFMQFGTGRGSEGLKTGEMVQQSQPTAHGWPRWGEYMRTKGTKGMTMFEYLSQGGGCGGGSICGGAKKNRKKSIWYKEAGAKMWRWFQRQDVSKIACHLISYKHTHTQNAPRSRCVVAPCVAMFLISRTMWCSNRTESGSSQNVAPYLLNSMHYLLTFAHTTIIDE